MEETYTRNEKIWYIRGEIYLKVEWSIKWKEICTNKEKLAVKKITNKNWKNKTHNGKEEKILKNKMIAS